MRIAESRLMSLDFMYSSTEMTCSTRMPELVINWSKFQVRCSYGLGHLTPASAPNCGCVFASQLLLLQAPEKMGGWGIEWKNSAGIESREDRRGWYIVVGRKITSIFHSSGAQAQLGAKGDRNTFNVIFWKIQSYCRYLLTSTRTGRPATYSLGRQKRVVTSLCHERSYKDGCRTETEKKKKRVENCVATEWKKADLLAFQTPLGPSMTVQQ